MAGVFDPPWSSDPTEPIPPYLDVEEETPHMRTQLPPPPTPDEPIPGAVTNAGVSTDTPKTVAPPPTPLILILPAWFGGYRLRTLAKTPSESTFTNSLGLGVLAVSGFSAIGATVAIADVAQKPILSMFWVGAIWWAVMACVIERLVLQVTSTKKWQAMVVTFVLRLALSVLIAGGIAEPLVVLFNGPEINNVLIQKQTAEETAATKQTDATYNHRIAKDYRQIAAIRRHENKLSGEVEHFKFLESCEAGAPDCSHHAIGEGVWWAHDRRQAANYQAQLDAIRPQDKTEIQNLQADITAQRKAKHKIVGQRVGAIDKSGGFVARMEALSTVEKVHPIVWWETWFLRAFFLLVDLLPLSSKYLRMWSLESPYEAQLAAERRADGLPAKRLEADCEVEEDAIKHTTTARKDVNRWRILSGAAAAIDGPLPIGDTWNLGRFAKEMTSHESRPVTVPPALRRAGNVALGTALGVGLADALWTLLTGSMLTGTPLIAGTIAALAGLAAFTRGFRRAAPWSLRAIYAGLLSSFALPVAVLGLQLL